MTELREDDNRRANLRAVTPRGNSQNVRGHGRSGYRGVYPTRHGRWQAKIHIGDTTHYLGTFANKEEAALVVDAKRRELMPEYVGIRSRKFSHGKPETRTAVERARRKARAEAIRAGGRGALVPEPRTGYYAAGRDWPGA